MADPVRAGPDPARRGRRDVARGGGRRRRAPRSTTRPGPSTASRRSRTRRSSRSRPRISTTSCGSRTATAAPARPRPEARAPRHLDIDVLMFCWWRSLTVGEAAARTHWSPRMLRYLEQHGLVVPRRTAGRLPRLRARRAEPAPLAARAPAAASGSGSTSSPSPRGSAASPSCARGRRLARRRRRQRLLDRLGAAQARAAPRRLTTTDTTLADERERMRWRRRGATT